MIIGLSHITFNCVDFENQLERWVELGWTELFSERDVLNHPVKLPFLNKYEPTHHLRVLERPGYNTIEIVQHGDQIFESNNVYQRVGDGVVKVNCYKYHDSLDFWRDHVEFTEDGDCLFKSSPFTHWNCRLRLESANEPPISKLDNTGVSCLAFYTTDISKDTASLGKKAKSVSEEFDLLVNGKKLRISMIEGPSSEFIELIGFDQK